MSTALDRRLIAATQGGLPLCAQPYARIAAEVGAPVDQVMERLKALLAAGIIRRIGAVPNHYALGYRANGMSVWDVPDDQITALGQRVGALDFVSQCYRRPRQLPHWPYNLFAMVHGHDRAEVADLVGRIATLLGSADHGHDVLFSTRILKKTGLRLTSVPPAQEEMEKCSV